MKNLLLILFVAAVAYGCSYKGFLSQRDYYKVIFDEDNESLILKSLNGPTLKCQIKEWDMGDKAVFNVIDSNATYYFLERAKADSIFKTHEELVESGYQEKLGGYLNDSLVKYYGKDRPIREIDLLKDSTILFSQYLYWNNKQAGRFTMKDIIKPNHYYKVDFGNNSYGGNHVHNKRTYFETFLFIIDDNKKLVYFEKVRSSAYHYREPAYGL